MPDTLDLDGFENEGGPVAAEDEAPDQAATEPPADVSPAPAGDAVFLKLGPRAYGPLVVNHLGLPDVTADGALYSREQADEVLTIAMITGVDVVEGKN